MREVARVCKAGGIVITINPVSWPYHEAPIDCWRAYPEGMKALYEDSKLEVIFSGWESLEEPQFRNYMPGASREARPRRSWDWLTDCSADSGIRSNVPMTRLQSVGRRPGLRSLGRHQRSRPYPSPVPNRAFFMAYTHHVRAMAGPKMLSVVIPTYQRPVWMVRAVRSLQEQSRPPDEVVAVARDADLPTHEAIDKLGREPLPFKLSSHAPGLRPWFHSAGRTRAPGRVGRHHCRHG